MAIQVTLKKWGNSKGILLPKNFIEEQHLKDDESFLIDVIQQADFSEDFGALKGIKMSGQKFKNIVKKGWEK